MESQRHKSIIALTADCDDASFNMIEKELFRDDIGDCSDSSDDCISSVLQYQADVLVDNVLIEKEQDPDIDVDTSVCHVHVSQACTEAHV